MLFSLVPAVVTSFISNERSMEEKASVTNFQGAMLFPDISGFTRLSDMLGKQGQAGAEALSVVINSYFKLMLDIISEFQGDVIKFAGDALQVVWRFDQVPSPSESSSIGLVAFCGWKMIKELDHHPTLFQYVLRLKAALAWGNLSGMHLGVTGGRWEYCIAGEPLDDVARCEKLAGAGDFVVSRRCWMDGVESYGFQGAELDGGDVLISDFVLSLPRILSRDLPSWNGAVAGTPEGLRVLERYVNTHFVNKLVRVMQESGDNVTALEDALRKTAELRRVTVVFVTLPQYKVRDGVAGVDQFQDLVADLFGEVNKWGGQIRQLICDDKGVVVISVFGLPPLVHSDDVRRAVSAGLGMLCAARKVGHVVGVGVTTGEAFVGGVGSGARFEYSVMGDVVNMSARISCKAHNEVIVSRLVADVVATDVVFDEREPMQLKGKALPVRVKCAVRLRTRTPKEMLNREGFSQTSALIVGRERELARIDEALVNFCGGSRGALLVIHAVLGMGGSRMLEACLELCHRYSLASSSTTAVLAERRSPYFALKSLLRERARGVITTWDMQSNSHPNSPPGVDEQDFQAESALIESRLTAVVSSSRGQRGTFPLSAPSSGSGTSSGLRRKSIFGARYSLALKGTIGRPTVVRVSSPNDRKMSNSGSRSGSGGSGGSRSIVLSMSKRRSSLWPEDAQLSAARARDDGGSRQINRLMTVIKAKTLLTSLLHDTTTSHASVDKPCPPLDGSKSPLVSSQSLPLPCSKLLSLEEMWSYLPLLAPYIDLTMPQIFRGAGKQLHPENRRMLCDRVAHELLRPGLLPDDGQHMVVAVDDAHYLDERSMSLLANAVRVAPILVLLVSETLDLPHFNLMKRKKETTSMNNATGARHNGSASTKVGEEKCQKSGEGLTDGTYDTTIVALRGLGKADVVRLTCASLQVTDVPHVITDYVYKKAQGNPVYSLEFVAAIQRANILQVDDGRGIAKLNVGVLMKSRDESTATGSDNSNSVVISSAGGGGDEWIQKRRATVDTVGTPSQMSPTKPRQRRRSSFSALSVSGSAVGAQEEEGVNSLVAGASQALMKIARGVRSPQRIARCSPRSEAGSHTPELRQQRLFSPRSANILGRSGDMGGLGSSRRSLGAILPRLGGILRRSEESALFNHRTRHGVTPAGSTRARSETLGDLPHSQLLPWLPKPGSFEIAPDSCGSTGGSPIQENRGITLSRMLDRAMSLVVTDMSCGSLVMSRVGALERDVPELVELLKIASVIGLSINFSIWEDVVRRDADQLISRDADIRQLIALWRREHHSMWAQLMRVGGASDTTATPAVVSGSVPPIPVSPFRVVLTAIPVVKTPAATSAALSGSSSGGLAPRRSEYSNEDGTPRTPLSAGGAASSSSSNVVTYYFRNEFVQQAFYNLMLPSRRRALHGAVAQHLEAQSGLLSQLLPQLIHHWRGAERGDKVFTYCTQAGKLAFQEQRAEESAEWWRQARVVCEAPIQHALVSAGLAEARAAMGNMKDARHLLQEAIELLNGDVEPLVRLDSNELLPRQLQALAYRCLVDLKLAYEHPSICGNCCVFNAEVPLEYRDPRKFAHVEDGPRTPRQAASLLSTVYLALSRVLIVEGCLPQSCFAILCAYRVATELHDSSRLLDTVVEVGSCLGRCTTVFGSLSPRADAVFSLVHDKLQAKLNIRFAQQERHLNLTHSDGSLHRHLVADEDALVRVERALKRAQLSLSMFLSDRSAMLIGQASFGVAETTAWDAFMAASKANAEFATVDSLSLLALQRWLRGMLDDCAKALDLMDFARRANAESKASHRGRLSPENSVTGSPKKEENLEFRVIGGTSSEDELGMLRVMLGLMTHRAGRNFGMDNLIFAKAAGSSDTVLSSNGEVHPGSVYWVGGQPLGLEATALAALAARALSKRCHTAPTAVVAVTSEPDDAPINVGLSRALLLLNEAEAVLARRSWRRRDIFVFYAHAFVAEVLLTMWELRPQEEEQSWSARMSRAMERVEALAQVLRIAQPRLLLLRGWQLMLNGDTATGRALWKKGVKLARSLRMPCEEALILREMSQRGLLPRWNQNRTSLWSMVV